MNLLLSNDDGFDSEGLKILADKLSQKHRVFIIAPDSNRSAVEDSITPCKVTFFVLLLLLVNVN